MGFFLPALLFGGLGVSHLYASKELEDVIREGDQPLFGFWWGVSIGFVAGLWVGWNSSDFIFTALQSLGGIIRPLKSYSQNFSNETPTETNSATH